MHHVKPWQSLWLCLLSWATAAQVVHQWTHQRGGEGDEQANSLQVEGNVEQNLVIWIDRAVWNSFVF